MTLQHFWFDVKHVLEIFFYRICVNCRLSHLLITWMNASSAQWFSFSKKQNNIYPLLLENTMFFLVYKTNTSKTIM